MKANKKHIGKEDFQRYLDNQMTDAERNSFERELQKNQFEAEALEGFQHISTAELQKDLKDISGKISSGKKKNNTRYWAAAATFLVLISTGVIWFQLKEKSLFPEMAETKSIQNEEIKTPKTETQNQELNKPTEEKNKVATLEISDEPTAKKAVKKQVGTLPVADQKKNEEAEMEKSVQFAVVNEPKQEEKALVESKVVASPKPEIRIRGVSSFKENRKTGTGAPSGQLVVGDTKIVWGKVISLNDSLPIPGVTIMEKGTSNGTVSDLDGHFIVKLTNTNDSVLVASFIGMEKKEFYPARDSSLVIGLEPSALALDEVVTVGYGVRKQVYADESIKNAQPKNSMSKFRKYMDEHAILPNSFAEKRVVVKVALHLNAKGEIISVGNKNNSDSTVFELAKQIILNGPAWDSETINGTPVESDISLRIVFRKEK